MPTQVLHEEIDVFAARTAMRQFAQALGFTRQESEELAIVVSELAWNILRHAGSGHIQIDRVEDPVGGLGIRILASDPGAPIADLELAIQDGYDSAGPIDPATLLRRGGIGGGLGAVVRFTDQFEMRPRPEGKEIEVQRFRVRPRRAASELNRKAAPR